MSHITGWTVGSDPRARETFPTVGTNNTLSPLVGFICDKMLILQTFTGRFTITTDKYFDLFSHEDVSVHFLLISYILFVTYMLHNVAVYSYPIKQMKSNLLPHLDFSQSCILADPLIYCICLLLMVFHISLQFFYERFQP